MQNLLCLCHKKYPDATVVFDGCNDGLGTKYSTHFHRYGGYVGPEVRFNREFILQSTKEPFLANGRASSASWNTYVRS